MARSSKKAESPSALKLKTCTREIREGSKHVKCGKQYLGDDSNCPNAATHLLKYPTGFCNGFGKPKQCEGTRVESPGGKLMRTCDEFITCPCDCHDMMGKMFEASGQDRMLVDLSGYAPPPSEFLMPDRFADRPLSITGEHAAPVMVESVAPDLVPPSVARSFAPTLSGRTPKGQLETWVKRECDVWLIDQPNDLCTPQYLASEIARIEGITPPSVGAIGAIFDRWVALGFAICERKPVRFESYTEQGKALGLERMKAQKKDAERRARADQNRGRLR